MALHPAHEAAFARLLNQPGLTDDERATAQAAYEQAQAAAALQVEDQPNPLAETKEQYTARIQAVIDAQVRTGDDAAAADAAAGDLHVTRDHRKNKSGGRGDD